MACCGDAPTLEILAAVSILREHLPELKIRVINVVDLMKLQPASEHPHGLSDTDFDSLFTTDKPIIFAFHGYPWLVHRLTYRRANPQPSCSRIQGGRHDHDARSTCACKTTSTAFILCRTSSTVCPSLGSKGAYLKQTMRDKLIEHKHYIDEHGEDLPEIRNWMWDANANPQAK